MDRLSSHFCLQSEVHYFWTASARILVYSQKQSILRACRVCRSHLSELSQPLIFCFVPLPVQQYCNQSSYPYCRYYRYVSSIYTTTRHVLQLNQSQFCTVVRYGSGSNESQQRINHFSLASLSAVDSNCYVASFSVSPATSQAQAMHRRSRVKCRLISFVFRSRLVFFFFSRV